MTVKVDVIIVGFGPAGEMLTSLLGQRGHRVAVFDKFPEPYGLPRMSTLDGEVARLLQHAADPKEALAESLAQRQVELWGADGVQKGFFDWDYKRAGHPSHLSLHQPNIEAAMETRISTCPEVQVHWGRSVIDIRESGGDYMVTTVSAKSEKAGSEAAADKQVFEARYVVGMDGANSFVRNLLGIDVEVLHNHDDRWVLTDYDVVKALPNNLEKRIYFDLDYDRPYFFAPNGVGRVRTDVRSLPSDSEEEELDEDIGLDFLEEKVGIPRDSVRQTRRKSYRFRSQIATAMRRGNIFIGGDSAHAMTPYMGQGACTAMRDAANLAWKLDLVLRGVVAEELLNSYESERLGHSRFFVEGSLAAYKMINPATPAQAAERDGYIAATGGNVTPPIPFLRDGVLFAGPDGEYGAQAGAVAPQGVVSDGVEKALLDDIVGPGFHLVSLVELDEALGPERLIRLDQIGVKRIYVGTEGGLVDSDGTYRDYFGQHASTTMLSRPDVYVFGLADGVDDAVSLVDSLLSQLPAPSASPA